MLYARRGRESEKCYVMTPHDNPHHASVDIEAGLNEVKGEMGWNVKIYTADGKGYRSE